MRRLAASLLPALLAGCIAGAHAQDPGGPEEGGPKHDVLTLTSGERLIGELVDVRDGRYWVMLVDGRMVSADFRTVSLVEMGGRGKPVAAEDLPLPTWQEPRVEQLSKVGGGFDLGLQPGARVRFRFQTPAVSHVDVRASFAALAGSGVALGFVTGGEIAFFGRSPVHLTLGALAGPALVYGSFYPFVGATAGVQFDPKGPVEVHLGAGAGVIFGSPVFTPDLSVSWVW